MNKPIVICLSGKRHSGKTNVSNMIKNHMELVGLTVKITSLSYFCKKEYCDKNNVDFQKILSDHKFKDLHRDKLTEYFLTTDPMTYPVLLEKDIDANKYKIYVIDDMRLLVENAEYFRENCSLKWNLFYVRVNALDNVKIKRGWIRSQYDDLQCENDLDNYEEFDYVINNNGSFEELDKNVIKMLKSVTNKVLI